MTENNYRPVDTRYEAGMKYRRAGHSGIQLPEISLGLWHNFGDVDTLSESRLSYIMLLIVESPILIWLIIMDLLLAVQRKRSDM